MHYTNYITPQLQLHYTNYNYTTLHYTTTATPLHYNYNSTTPHYIQQLWVRWPLQPLEPLQETQLQPPYSSTLLPSTIISVPCSYHEPAICNLTYKQYLLVVTESQSKDAGWRWICGPICFFLHRRIWRSGGKHLQNCATSAIGNGMHAEITLHRHALLWQVVSASLCRTQRIKRYQKKCTAYRHASLLNATISQQDLQAWKYMKIYKSTCQMPPAKGRQTSTTALALCLELSDLSCPPWSGQDWQGYLWCNAFLNMPRDLHFTTKMQKNVIKCNQPTAQRSDHVCTAKRLQSRSRMDQAS